MWFELISKTSTWQLWISHLVVQLCAWNIDFYGTFFTVLLMLSTGDTCPHFADFLCSWIWHVLEKKSVSTDAGSILNSSTAATHPRWKRARGQPVSTPSWGFTATSIQRLSNSCWWFQTYFRDPLYLGNRMHKINQKSLWHRLFSSSVKILSFYWEQI